MSLDNTLVAGPYVGEFGWELMSWQGYVRRIAKNFSKTIVCAATAHQALYADYATTYLPFDAAGVRDCWWLANNTEVVIAQQDKLRGMGSRYIIPVKAIKLWDQDFIKFGVAGAEPTFDVLMHARGPIGKRPHHSWNLRNWIELVQLMRGRGWRVATIGTEAFAIPGVTDFRNVSMQRLMNLMASCMTVIGPSSGPMHLASLCGAPHFVWTDNSVYQAVGCNNKRRYMEIWNPLRTPCAVLDSFGWDPPVDEIFNALVPFHTKMKEQRCQPQ